MKSMTKIQQSYEAGASLNQDLGGVPAHVYLECDGGRIDMAKLRSAWTTLLQYQGLSSPLNDYVAFFDCSDLSEEEAYQERLEYRRAFQQRMTRSDRDHFCGLAVFRLSNGRDCIHFDMNLMAGDPAGFQILLGQLGRLYQGKPLPDKKGQARQSPPSEEDLQYWNTQIPDMNPGPILPMKGSPEEMHHCIYRALRVDLTKKEWEGIKQRSEKNNVTPSVWTMAVFACLLQEEAGTSFLLNLPVFGKGESQVDDPEQVRDRTRLLLLSIHPGDQEENVIRRFHEAFSHIGYDGLEVMEHLRRKNPDCHLIAPTVFSATPGVSLISEEFRDSFGTLTYLISQTPQVCLDAQIYECLDSACIAWMIPEGLYDETYIKDLFDRYQQRLLSQ